METLTPNREFEHLASEDQITNTVKALKANGIQTFVVATGEEARECVREMIPAGVEVYNSASRTLELIGLAGEIETSTRFQAVRPRLHALDRKTQMQEIRQRTSGPDVLVGSVQAITEQGQIMIASATGSQLGAAAFGANMVIWVVGAQKLVRTMEDGLRRIREYSYPLEDARTRQAYGQPSAINKILIVNGELPGRITVVLVKQNLGF
jgi:L-lactate utilization protein LutC